MRKITPEKIGGEEKSLEPEREIWPHFHISLQHLPEAKDWEIGDEYDIKLRVRMSDLSIHKREEEDNGGAGFEILEIGVGKEKRELPDKE